MELKDEKIEATQKVYNALVNLKEDEIYLIIEAVKTLLKIKPKITLRSAVEK